MSKPVIQFAVQANEAQKKFRVIAVVKVQTKDLKKAKSKTVAIGMGIQHRRIQDLDKEVNRLKKRGYIEEYSKTVNVQGVS